MAESREYTVKNAIPSSVAEVLQKYSALTRQLLYNRGIENLERAEIFMQPDYDTQPHDPFLLTDMEKAVERILRAMREQEHIVIYTDYDCDGIPGGVLLHDFFTAIGYLNFENYIPHRHYEGYGFNASAVSKFVESNAKLIITVDCGITDHPAVERAQGVGIDVIVTDHHEPSETLPPAYAVVNPKRDNAYPFQGICGTTVAYKLVQGVLVRGRADGSITLKEGLEKWWLDLVGLATIADMVPLTDENRVFARYGLSVLRKSKRPGLQHLLKKAGTKQSYLNEDDVGFTIAPRINAASRMDTPEDAFHMLRTRDEVEAGTYVAHLETLNNERKGVVASMTKEAKKRIHTFAEIPTVLVLGNPEWRPSLVGLVANALAEEFKKPAFVWGRDGNGILKGSCRSEGRSSVVKLMDHARDGFLTFGGHHASGGFSVHHDRIHTLTDILTQAFITHHAELVRPSEQHQVDASISFDDITDDFLRSLDALGPFGMGNPKPLFALPNVRPYAVESFGKTKNHTKMRFVHERNFYDAICFFKLPHEFSIEPKKDIQVTLIAHIERSHFMGRYETRLRIVDVV